MAEQIVPDEKLKEAERMGWTVERAPAHREFMECHEIWMLTRGEEYAEIAAPWGASGRYGLRSGKRRG